ncbi:glutathione S-transferase [Brevundimonas sp. 2R-24]|uniref:Glutathione S-transferase n=1 Tax=Peiella sedimenti TaxID=3061083 RepID=A0ABT8SPE6_9CAUL|nr:glutathione S-transferase [Caulobacteraceae bacterium XZ-24]
MITVHHLEASRSFRTVWLLEELGVPYELVQHRRDKRTIRAGDELKAVHPLGKSPVIVDGPVVLPESGAIQEYLLNRHDPEHRLRPPVMAPERIAYDFWTHFAEGSAMGPLLIKLIVARAPTQAAWPVRGIARKVLEKVDQATAEPQLRSIFSYVETELGRRPWFAGDRFTGADIMMSLPLLAAVTRWRKPDQLPRSADFLKRIRERPAFRAAEGRAGKYNLPGG